jgi:alpha-D-ribose 1-methylphosphonate 5-triphosphate synthase subunit PhnG
MSTLNTPARGNWPYALSAISKEKLKRAVEEICLNWEIKPKTLPQSGLGLLQLKESALSENFFLGEFPVSSAYITITLPNGDKIEGASIIMSDDPELAERLAICDAVLSAKLSGHEQIDAFVQEGLRIREEQQKVRNAMLASTQVDFSLLDTVEERK